MLIWRRLFLHTAASAADLARDNAGNSNAARIAITAITTKSSMRVKAGCPLNLAPHDWNTIPELLADVDIFFHALWLPITYGWNKPSVWSRTGDVSGGANVMPPK